MSLVPITSSSPPSKMALPDDELPLEAQLTEPLLLADRVRKSATESLSSKLDCSEVAKHVDRLSHMLRSLVRFTTTITTVYDRPIRRISSEVSQTLIRTHTLVRKCRRRTTFFYRLVTLVTTAEFRKVFSLLDASAADLRWLLSVLRVDVNTTTASDYNDVVLSLPPIASNDPIIAWIWSFTATIQMGPSLSARIEAAHEIGSLAQDNDRNKKMIVEEGGIHPLLKLLKEGSSIEAQIAAASALYDVANNGERVREIVDDLGVPLIVHVLGDSPMKVQIKVSDLIARMAEFDDGVAKEELGRENVVPPLVSLLSFEAFEDENDKMIKQGIVAGKQSIRSVVDIINNKERKREYLSLSSSLYSEVGSSRGGGLMGKGRENESCEVKREMKVSCAKALWMLAKNSESNSRRITETKGLLCLAKLIEKEKGVLQKNCVMAIMEITSAAESNADLRRSAFKTSSPAAKAVVEQLLRVFKESNNDPSLQISCVRSIGSLARTFPARETRVIGPLVEQLSNKDHEVATEAVIALVKFVDPDNFLCQEHSKTIIEFNGVLPLLRLLRESERAVVHGLVLLCHLAMNASNNEALEQARVLTALEGVYPAIIAHHPLLKELIVKAIFHLDLYRVGIPPLRQSSMRL